MWMAVAEVPAAYAGAIGAVANQTPVSGTTSYDIVLGSAPATDSVVFSAFMQDFANTKQYTLPTGFTLLHDAYDSTAQQIDAAAYKVGGAPQTHTWSGLEAVNRRLGCAVEIKVPVPAALYSDDFNRANGALTTPWVTIDGSHSIVSGKVTVGPASPNDSYYDAAFSADQWAEADLDNEQDNQGVIFPVVRMGSSGGGDLYYYWIGSPGTRQFQINKRQGGSYSTVVSSGGPMPTGPFKARLEIQGATLRA